MTLTEILLAALADPFRVGLLALLVLTQRRTEAVTGRVLPLAVGVVFVAILLPLTMQARMPFPDLARAVAVGLVANAILLAVVLGAFALWDRSRR